MKNKIKELNLLKKTLTKELKIWVKDKSIPLDERWDVFHDSQLGEELSFYEEFEGVDSDGYYDNYYIDKYQTVYTKNLFEMASEKRYNKQKAELDTIEKQNAFKEDVLNKFVKSFEMNW